VLARGHPSGFRLHSSAQNPGPMPEPTVELSVSAPKQATPPANGNGAPRPDPLAGFIPIRLVLKAMRRHSVLVVSVTAFLTTFAFVLFKQPAVYQASAVLRLTEDRARISGGMEEEPEQIDRTTGRVTSLVPLLRSRTLAGVVTDSLGLQLRPFNPFSLSGSSAPALPFRDVRIDAATPYDTVYLEFADSSMLGRRGNRLVRVGYGQPLRLGPAQFKVAARPSVDAVAVGVLPRDVAIDNLLMNLAVAPVVGTDAVSIKFVDRDPAMAQRVTNTLVRTFYAMSVSWSQEQGRRRRIFLGDQLGETERLLSKTQRDLSTFRSRRLLASSSDKLASQQATLLALDSRRGELETDRLVFRALLSKMQDPNDSAREDGLRTLAYSPDIAGDPIVSRLYQQMFVYQTRLDSLTTGPWQSAANNPDVVQLKQLLSSSQVELERAVKAHLGSLDQRITALGALQKTHVEQLQILPNLQAEEERLSQQVAAVSEFANQIRLEFQKARMSEQLAAGNIQIVDLATKPYLPVGVPWWLKVGLAFGFGLLLSGALATLLEMQNHSIREPEELSRALPVRGLGVIPPVLEQALPSLPSGDPRALGSNGVPVARFKDVVADSPSPSIGVEAFRMLYSSLTHSWRDHGRTILVTSVAPQEGKTLVAANLAVTFAREGARVLLVDCDVRRPRLHKIFRVSRAPGLSDLLTREQLPGSASPKDRPKRAYSMMPDIERPEEEDATVAETGVRTPVRSAPRAGTIENPIMPTNIKNLSILPCGSLSLNPAEVLTAGGFRKVLEEIAADFHVIILDTPPVLVSADAVILAPVADGVLIVVRAGQTNRDAASLAYQQLTAAGARVVGAVLNDPAGEVARESKLYYLYDYPTAHE
jgi:polysaccharide biosynthesis transport protein